MSEPTPPPVPPRGADLDDPPPILGSWRNLYLLLLGELFVLIVVFALLRRWAS